MKYLATIKRGINRQTMLFSDEMLARQWLDENNNNADYHTYIEKFDDDWNRIDEYTYTEGSEE